MEAWILMVMFAAGGRVHYIEQPNREACFQAGADLDKKEHPFAWGCINKRAIKTK